MAFSVVLRPIPETLSPGVPDPRILGLWLESRAHPKPGPRDMAELRASMGWPTLDLTSGGVDTQDAVLTGRAGPVPVRVSRPSGTGLGPSGTGPGPSGTGLGPSGTGLGPSGTGPSPAVVYFHGGGFVGGTLKAVDNQCRLLAERAGAVVFNVDYRLAPEHPFPAGLHDAWDAVKAVHDTAASWGVDPTRIAVAGDSAGGNLALACSILDRREGKRRIAAQLLVYPVADLRTEAGGHHPWSEDEYEVRAWPELVRAAVRGLKDAGPFFNDHYLQGHDPSDPLVSPLAHPTPADFPPTLVLTAEFDFLRVEGEALARRLAEAGVTVRAVRYRGLEHAFFDKLGLCPQTADAVAEMAAFLGGLPAEPGADARLQAQLAFLAEADKLKSVVRRNELADASRRENTAEHSWHLVLFALTLSEHAPPGLDLGHAVKLCALHDLVEIDAGDTFFWDEKGYQDKEARERAAARRLFGLLPGAQADEFRQLWEEFEACQTPEALYANAVDRLAPVLLNSLSGGRSWRENGVTADKILAKMTVIAQASPRLGRTLEALVAGARDKGYLGSAPEAGR